MKFIMRILIFCLLLFAVTTGFAQQSYDLVIKGGHVIDPKNGIDGPMDVAVLDGKIARVAKDISATGAKQVVHADGMYITPGLIDIHGHVFYGTDRSNYLSNGSVAVVPDGFTFRVGVTTIVDAGGAGWKSFRMFKENIIDQAQTRVLSFLNIVGEGMRGGAYEQSTNDMDPKLAAQTASANRNYIVGFKLAHYDGHDWTGIERVTEAGRQADLPVLIDFGGSTPPLSIEELFLKRLRPGDIFAHTYTLLPGNVRETIVDEAAGKVKPFVWEARKRGINFEVGYGGASFNYSQAIPAVKEGFYPDAISTDLHTGSMNSSMKDQLSVMSKFLNMGMPLADVIEASTWKPATIIKRQELGNLSEGSEADIAILTMRKGNFGFYDKTGYKVEGDRKFECEMTIRGGRIVYDLNGIADPIYVRR